MIQTFTIPGEPVGKGRPRFGRTKNGGVHTYTPDKTAKYETLVRRCWLDSACESFGGKQLYVYINAYFPIPKSYSGRRTAQIKAFDERPTKKPDCDNIVKVILDALNDVAYCDDKQVVDVRCVKRYANPGEDGRAEVVIGTISAGEALVETTE